MMRLSLPRIERWIWYVFLVTLAWQTRIILWQADRIFIEWRSISLYVSDVLMLGLFSLALVYSIRNRSWRRPIRIDAIDLTFVAFLFAALLSLRSTDQLMVSVYQWGRLLQYGIFYFYVRYRAVKEFDADASMLALVIGALGQAIIALAQYAVQHDIGLRWLGETLLTTHMPGVAVFYDVGGVKILRAYGTLPHPNVLAVYLLVSLWALAYLYLRHAHDKLGHHRWIWALAGVPMLWALYLTFSRTMIAIGMVMTIGLAMMIFWDRCSRHWPHIQTIRVRARQMLIVAVIASGVFGGLFWRQVIARASISSQEEAVTLRVYYAKEAIHSGVHKWLNLNWTGVGIGNFVGWLQRSDPGQPSWMYQPAHNLYLLVYSETGILGIGLFLAWLVLILRAAITADKRPGLVRWGLVMILIAGISIAMFDHFFWTLQQGRILFWLILAVIVAS